MNWKKALPDFVAVIIFVVISFAYFFPADIEGRILFQHDSAAGVGAGQEAKEYREATGKTTRWTNSLFGGMPTYQISPSYDSTNILSVGERAYRLFLPDYVQLVFIMLLGFYILLRAFGFSPWLSALGGIMWAFSSYFFILISAGHIWKFITLAYIPPTLAGIVWAYKGRLLKGGILTALFLALQIKSNHVQMSYYFLFVILFFVAVYLEEAWKQKTMRKFLKSTGVLALAALVGVSVNLSNLYHTYTYSKETMRGKSELTQTLTDASQASSGLDRDYITQWSYGISETMTLLIPNYKGGASVPLSQSERAMTKANPMLGSIYSQLTQYFGDQPMTAGPVYVGAFVLFLFVLGCFIVRGSMKWALVGATLLSILLAWGKNFMPLTDFFIDFVPMYNKFRAVSSILVIAEFTIPLLAMFCLREIILYPKEVLKQRRALMASLCIVVVPCLALWLAPESFNTLIPLQEEQMLQNAVSQQMIPQEAYAPIVASLTEMRGLLVSSDALRSLFFILAGCALLAAFAGGKMRREFTVVALAVLCLADLWTVNQRYLNDKQFVPAGIRKQTFNLSETDKRILEDRALDYRVLNFASNTFNENNTSYFHKSVGGYHAAKLRRYQELIEAHIVKEMNIVGEELSEAAYDITQVDGSRMPVLNMLNTRYFILPTDKKGGTTALANPFALGNAWFVSKVSYVNDADEELAMLEGLNPREEAVVDKRFRESLNNAGEVQTDSVGFIHLTKYEPNSLTYQTKNRYDGVAVFSEIYYADGWNVKIDGQKAALGRANYVLRTLYVPAGEHTIEMTFDPVSLHVTETIAYVALALLAIGLLVLLAVPFYKKRRQAVRP